MSTSDFLGYLWTAIFAIGWLWLTYEFIRAAWTGRFWFWRRKAGGKTWPPVRAEQPIRVWMLWALMAFPFLFITSLGLAGVGLAVLGQ